MIRYDLVIIAENIEDERSETIFVDHMMPLKVGNVFTRRDIKKRTSVIYRVIDMDSEVEVLSIGLMEHGQIVYTLIVEEI